MKDTRKWLGTFLILGAASSIALANTTDFSDEDVDPYVVLAPGESIEVNGETIANERPVGGGDITVLFCPGKGERCEVSVRGVKYREEKDPNKNPIEIRW